MEQTLIPVSILSEYVYCPRLAYMHWVQGESASNADLVEGRIAHKNVDKGKGKISIQADAAPMEAIHAHSVDLGSETLGIRARLDLVEGEGNFVYPVEYKKGKRPHISAGAYESERVQLCAQGLLLQEHGFRSDHGFIYFAGSRERVRIPFDENLISATHKAIAELHHLALADEAPPPLSESPKCPRCSLIGICLPDETGLLVSGLNETRPFYPGLEHALPLYVQSPASRIRKDGNQFIVEEDKEKLAEVRIMDVSQVVLFGHCGISSPAMHACFRNEIPVSFMTYGGWFLGHSMGVGLKNVFARIAQYQASFDPDQSLLLAKSFVRSKIRNCRTLLRRNWKEGENENQKPLLQAMKNDLAQVERALSIQELLGMEGMAARRYFEHFSSMLRPEVRQEIPEFDFTGRNKRPPRDPVNALLSFAYAMLTREWTISLSAVGLDPYRGFLHKARFGRPALSLDIMEGFRPLIADSVVIMVINNGEIGLEDFIFGPGSCNLKPNGRKRFIAAFERRMHQEITHPVFHYKISYRRAFEVQARLLVRYLVGEIPDYPEFVTR